MGTNLPDRTCSSFVGGRASCAAHERIAIVGAMQDFFRALFVIPMPFLVLGTAGLIVWRWRRASRALLAASAAGLLLTSLPVTGKLLRMPLLYTVQEWEPGGAPVDAILVPTGGIFFDGNGRWWAAASSVRRLAAALAIRDAMIEAGRDPVPIVISGGPTMDDGPAEATVLAHQFGLSGPGVVLETAALNSHQTAVNLKQQLRRLEIRSLLVVTDPWHMARMAGVLKHQGFHVTGATVDGPRQMTAGFDAFGWSDFLPQPHGFRLSARSIDAMTGVVWYLASGRLRPGDLGPGN